MSSPIVGAMLENAVLFVGYRQIQRYIRMYSPPVQTPDTILDKDNQVPLSMNQLVLAGSIAGALVSVVLTPVELIKCQLQVQYGSNRYKGPLDVMQRTFKASGVQGFYRGFLPTLVRETGGGAFWFGTYEYCCAMLIKRRQALSHRRVTKDDLTAPELMLSGAMGGIAYNVSFFPVDVVKSRMQIQDAAGAPGNRVLSYLQITKEIYRGTGIKGFYRGCGITAAKSAPANAIIFLTYVSN